MTYNRFIHKYEYIYIYILSTDYFKLIQNSYVVCHKNKMSFLWKKKNSIHYFDATIWQKQTSITQNIFCSSRHICFSKVMMLPTTIKKTFFKRKIKSDDFLSFPIFRKPFLFIFLDNIRQFNFFSRIFY